MTGAKRWVAVMPAKALEPAWVTCATVGSRAYAIYDTPDGVRASLAYCTHQGAPLCDGYFDRYTIECPLHQGCFDVRTGAATGAPATRPLRLIEARVVDGMVELRIPAGSAGQG